MEEKHYCPTCHKELERIAACGATNYFCNHCKKLVSSKAALDKQQLEDQNKAGE